MSSQIRPDLVRWAFAGALSSTLAVGAVLLGYNALADQDALTDQVPRLIPYSGTIEVDGAPVTRTGVDAITMRFDVCDVSDCSSVQFSQSMPVEVFNGHFTALIGEDNPDGTVLAAGSSSIEEVVGWSDDLYLKIYVDLGDGEVELGNVQRLGLTRGAVLAQSAHTFEISGDLTVGGDLTAEGSVVAGGALRMDDNPDDADDDRAFHLDGSTYVVAGDLTSGTDIRSDATGDALTVNGLAHIDGDVALTGTTISFPGSGNAAQNNGTQVTLNPSGALGSGTEIGSEAQFDGALDVTAAQLTIDPNDASVDRIVRFEADDFNASDQAQLRFYRDGSGGNVRFVVEAGNDNNDDISIKTNGTERINISGSGGVQLKDRVDASSGSWNLGLTWRRCTPTSNSATDCNCNSGEVPISGGVRAANPSGGSNTRLLRESRLSGSGWRGACTQPNGDASTCEAIWVLCSSVIQ